MPDLHSISALLFLQRSYLFALVRGGRQLLGILLMTVSLVTTAHAAPDPVTQLTINGAIGPANADYVVRGIAQAADNGSQLIIIKMDTPGGLDTSMRDIIKAILQSPVPVASFVAPAGARAASAGTYILYASHIAAMAPGTNLGAATPVQIGGPQQEPGRPQPERKNQDPENKAKSDDPEKDATSSPTTRKQVNDAAAYIRGLAQMRGRNVEWAEQAVREAVSLSADEALEKRVIEHVAVNVAALLDRIDGTTINVQGVEKKLQTKGATVIDSQPDWRAEILTAITNPSIALLLMTVGIYGLLFEFMNPGSGVPGVIGAICLLLAMYAFQMLPVNYVGLALILLGIAFMIGEAFVPSFGILGLGGVAAFIAGGLILIDTDVPGYGIPVALIVGVGIVSGLLIVGIVTIALQTRRRPAMRGPGDPIGSIAEMVDDAQREGWARLNGEQWQVISTQPVHRAQKVRVVGRQGLMLRVEPEDPPQ